MLSSQPRGLHFSSFPLAATHQHNCEDQQDVSSRGRLRWLGGRLGGLLLWDDVRWFRAQTEIRQLASNETLNPSPVPPFCRFQHISCPAPLSSSFSGYDSCSFVLQRPASGLVRTAASLIPEYPLIPRLCFVCRDKRGTEKKETKASNKNAKTDSSLRPSLARISSSPLPRLGSSRINVTSPSILSGFPLHPPNFFSAARGKREKEIV